MIRWIVDEKLGTAAADGITPDEHTVYVDARALVDKRGNSASALLAQIEIGVAALSKNKRTVVICDFGVSRSNTIAAGILATWRSLDVDKAIAEVLEKTGETSIKLEMIETLREALGRASVSDKKHSGILITGGAGFIGALLRDRLAESGDIHAPDRNMLDLLGPTVLLDRYCRENNVSKIVHLAYPRIYTNNESMGQSLTMLRNVLDVCKSQGTRLVLPSSWVVFSGYRTSLMDAGVATAPHPRGVYGEAKFLEEALVKIAVANGEIDATIIRLSPVYGAKSLRPRLIRFAHQYLLEDRAIQTHRYRNGLPLMQLLHVEDAVSGIANIVSRGRSPIYHLGGEEPYEPREIIARIAKILGRSPKVEEVAIDDDAANVCLDSGATKLELGWTPTIDLDQGLRHTLET